MYTVTDFNGNTTGFIYDDAGRLLRTNLPDGNFTTNTYDDLGRRISSTDAEGNTTQFAYDPQGRLIAVTDAAGETTRYGYDMRGLQISQTDALGRTTRYEYDVMGRRIARVLPGGERETMEYNNMGSLTAHTDFNGQRITRNYDVHTQNLLSIVAPSGHPSLTLSHAPARFEFTYDLLGRRLTSVSKDKLGGILTQETYTYNERSQLTGYTGPAGSIGYGYDPAGNLAGAKSGTTADDGTGVQAPIGYDVSYVYDAQNRISDVYRGQEGVDPSAWHLTAYTYDDNGNLFGIGYANGIQHAYNYNTVNRLTDLTVNRISGANTTALQGYGYTLDNNGMRTKITELSGRVVDHSYDSLMRLQSETITGGQAGDLTGALSYTYDVVSNRESRTTSGAIAALIPSQNHSFTVNDRLTSDTYDDNGNTTASQANVTPTQQSGVTDVYSFDNRLIRRTRADGMEIDLIYTPDGNRSLKWVKQGGLTLRQHRYLVDSNNPTGYAQVVEEHDPLASAGETLRKVHLYGHDLIASETHNGSAGVVDSHYYSYDGLGSVRAITDDQGLTEETYDYDAYGNLIGFEKYNPVTDALEVQDLTDPAFSYGSLTSEYLFTGEQWDPDLGMYFLRARYLNTATGRFHSMDTYEGRNGEPVTLHKYLYANGNPAMFVDPSGMLSLSEMTAAIRTQGALVSRTLVRYSPRAIKAAEKALAIVVRSAVLLNLTVATMNPKLSFQALVAAPYNKKQLQKFKRHKSLKRDTARKIKRIAGFIARASGKVAAANSLGINISPNGFPDYTAYMHPVRGAVFIKLTGARGTDKTRARLARGLPDPLGYVWHHHEAMGVMMLVRKDIHRKTFGHVGGVFFWEITNNKDYRDKRR